MVERFRSASRVVAAGLLLAGGLLAAGCATGGTAGGGGDSRFVAGKPGLVVVPAAEREAPVTLAGTTLEGQRLDLATLRGSVVVVNVWGSWCSPCREEAPDLEAAYQSVKDRGVAFVGINNRDPDPVPARAFQRKFGITYPSLRDEGGELLLALRGAVPPAAIPTTLVLDEQSRIAARYTGKVSKATLVGVIEDVLDEAGRA